ncbi:MAG: hypothetical protein QFB87_01485 [Patescibacteria group bacterium]|nr:hypothetical protein [Patescibacteria group bacterium]
MQQQLNELAIRIFSYFDQRFRSVDNRFRKQDRHIDGLYSLIDSYAKQLEIKEQQNRADDDRVARLENWVERLALQSSSKVQ